MNNVRYLRENAGMSQKELAITVGVAQPTVSNWESGFANPCGKRLEKLIKLFGVPAGVILGIDECPEETKKPSVSSELADAIIEDILALSPSQQRMVQAFVAGIKSTATQS